MSAPTEPKPTAEPALSPRQDDARETTGLNGTATDLSLEQRFAELATQWNREVGYLSNPAKKAENPAFLAILAMGKAVVPVLLRKVQKEPYWGWFLALHKITGADPVPEEDCGNVQKAAEAWARWGREKGYEVGA